MEIKQGDKVRVIADPDEPSELDNRMGVVEAVVGQNVIPTTTGEPLYMVRIDGALHGLLGDSIELIVN